MPASIVLGMSVCVPISVCLSVCLCLYVCVCMCLSFCEKKTEKLLIRNCCNLAGICVVGILYFGDFRLRTIFIFLGGLKSLPRMMAVFIFSAPHDTF